MTHQEITHTYLPGRQSELRGNAILVQTSASELSATIGALMEKLPLVTVFAADERKENGAFRIYYAFRVTGEDAYLAPVIAADGTSFPSLAREFPALALYEREIMTLFGLTAKGHPDPRTVILHEENWPKQSFPLRKDFAWNTPVPATHSGDYPYERIGGEGVYEIPVGPVHAGIIEPGHFRFSVAGEEILALEARLGWVHKGAEKLMETLPLEQTVKLSERVSGDSSFAHSYAFCGALERLTGTQVPQRAAHLRLVFAELERVTMHIFDIGNIGGNGTGFSFMAAQGFRLAEDMRRLAEDLTGSRFLRGVNVAGGVTKDLSDEESALILKTLERVRKDLVEMMRIGDNSASFINRLAGTGVLSADTARKLGAVGIAARCCGMARDVRSEQPYGAYASLIPHVAIEHGGDVEARFRVRIKEVFESMRLIDEALASLPEGPVRAALKPLPQSGMAIASVEGWRGEIAYAVMVEQGALSRVKIRDASFINWQLFPHMVGTDMVPDFPLINKSLNLSYSGNDL